MASKPKPRSSSKTRKPRGSQPATVEDLKDNNPSIVELLTSRMSKWVKLAITISALAAGTTVLYQGYFWMGGRAVITDFALDKAIDSQNKIIDSKITAVKTDVSTKVDDTKKEIIGNLDKVSGTLSAIAKSQSAASMDQADTKARLAFTQQQTLQAQLAVVNQALAKDPNDQLAATRKMQLEGFIRQNEQYMQDAQSQLNRLRMGN